MPDAPDRNRRRLLAKLGLATTAVYTAPVLMKLSPASASGSGGGGGRAGRSANRSRPSGRSRARTRPRRAAARTEIVVAAPDASAIQQIADAGYGLLSSDGLAVTGLQIARFALPGNVNLDQARQQILQLVPAALVDLNGVYRPDSLACENGECAAFEMIGWTSEIAACSHSVVVGMVDTTVNTDHAALAGIDIEVFPVRAEGRSSASAMHGTAIAILLAGRGDSRTPGLLSNGRLIAAEGFHRAAGGDVADAYDAARALDRVIERGAQVVNLSFSGPDNAVLGRVVEEALSRDVVLVAAAGNQGPNAAPAFPAAWDGVIAVTAVDGRNRVYRRANGGDHIDFAAPGVQLWTAASVSGGRFRSGTSFAAPFVTAAFAAERATNAGLKTEQLVDAFAAKALDLGDAGRDRTYGWGLIQTGEACQAPRTVGLPGE